MIQQSLTLQARTTRVPPQFVERLSHFGFWSIASQIGDGRSIGSRNCRRRTERRIFCSNERVSTITTFPMTILLPLRWLAGRSLAIRRGDVRADLGGGVGERWTAAFCGRFGVTLRR